MPPQVRTDLRSSAAALPIAKDRAQLSLPPTLVTSSVLRPPQASAYVGLAVQTLAKPRVQGKGPKHIALSRRSVGYRISDLDDWLSQRVRSSTSDPGHTKAKPPCRGEPASAVR
jgi:predicted DNA-binding transcriptional regulator AlpA